MDYSNFRRSTNIEDGRLDSPFMTFVGNVANAQNGRLLPLNQLTMIAQLLAGRGDPQHMPATTTDPMAAALGYNSIMVPHPANLNDGINHTFDPLMSAYLHPFLYGSAQ